MKYDSESASSVRPSKRSNYPQQQRITLYMIALELERDWTKLQSHFAKVITKVFGISQK